MKTDKKQRVNADNASHNLDAQIDDQGKKPSRDVADADFAAEAHGFTAYEKAGLGSSYEGASEIAGGSARRGPVGRIRSFLRSIFQR